MTKVKTLCNRLIAENRVEPYDAVGYQYPEARLKTLDTGIGHPVVYKSKLAPTVTRDGGGAVVVYEDNSSW